MGAAITFRNDARWEQEAALRKLNMSDRNNLENRTTSENGNYFSFEGPSDKYISKTR